jgi:GxxExxY protein
MKHTFLHGDLTDRILRCAVEIHREAGPGLPEVAYQRAMAVAMTNAGLKFTTEPELEIRFQDVLIGRQRPDFIVENSVVVELKAVKQIEPGAAKQMLSYRDSQVHASAF